MGFLIEGEQIVMKIHPSRILRARYYALAIILIVFPFLYNFFRVRLPVPEFYVLYLPIILGIILIIMAEISIRRNSSCITNYRVLSNKGILKRNSDSCTYDKMVNVKVTQSIPQRIMRIGTVNITTMQRSELSLNSVSNPSKIERTIYNMIEKTKSARPEPAQPQYTPAQDAYTPPSGTDRKGKF